MGYNNIREIGKDRIRRAGAKFIETDGQMQLGEEQKLLDIGFKVFKLDTSSLREWDSTPVQDNDLLLPICFAENITAEDIEAMAEYAPQR